MAITTKTVTGKIVIPGTTIGIRANVSATPMTTANALTFPADDTISWGPVSTTTNAAGTLTPALAIPTSQAETAVMWKVVAEPIDKHPGLPKSWTLGYYTITGTGTVDLADLVEIDVTAIDPGTIVSVQQMVTDAEAARDAAQAAQAAAEAVGSTNDTIIAGRVNDPASATRTALSATYASRWATGAVYVVGQPVVEPNGGAIMIVATAHTAGASFDVTKFKPAPGMPVNVRSYGCKGDWDKAAQGGTDDSTAFRAACDAADTYNRAIYIPAADPGKYYCVSNWFMKGDHVMLGDGPGRSRLIKHPTVSTGSVMAQPTTSNPRVHFEGFSIDGNGLGVTIFATKGVTGRMEFRRLSFTDCAGPMIQIGAPWALVDDCDFDGLGKIIGNAIVVQAGARDVYIKNVRGRYLYGGISCGSSTTKKVRYLSVSDSQFDGGWWTSIHKASGSGGSVTYTSTVITDTAATFTTGTNPPAVGDIIRVMTPLRTATITGFDGYAITMQDSGADFNALGVLKGDIIRTSDRMAVVRSVVSSTELLIEDWQSETDRSFTGVPNTGTAYTLYGVRRAAISVINSATQITTAGGFRNYNSVTSTPDAGTLYEILTCGSYQMVASTNATERVDLTNVTVRRSASDSIVVQSGDVTITRCSVEDGRDNGFVVGSTATPRGGKLIHSLNRAYHCGTAGHAIGWDSPNSIITNNIAEDCISFGTGSSDPANQGSFFIGLTTGGVLEGNVAVAGPGTRATAPSYRISANNDGLYINGNHGVGHTVGIKIIAGCQNIRLGKYQSSMVESVSDSGTGTLGASDTGVPLAPQVDILTGSGTWTRPAGATRHKVVAIAGGGQGGSGRRGAAGTIRCGGGAGGGGQITAAEFKTSDIASTEAYVCGAGGTGGGAAVTTDDTSGAAGSNGGNSYFGGNSSDAKVFARGGLGGSGGTATSGTGGSAPVPGVAAGASASTTGGTGGTAANGIARPTVNGGGGGGGGGGITSANADSGGGSGAAAISGSQTNAAGGVAPGNAGAAGSVSTSPLVSGGSGGGGAGSSSTAGGAGGAGSYGSGGGGGGASLNGFASGAGGNGGDGRIIVITYFS